MRRNPPARRNKGEDEDVSQIDLTPMLDVVFIMLIFFIVTAVFVKEPGVKVERPEATTAEKRDAANILVAVNENNEIWIDKQKVDRNGARAVIERMHAENPKSGLVVQADTGSNAETVVAVLDAAREAGVVSVSVATEEQ